MGSPGQSVRRHVRSAREERRWSQIDLAREAGVSRGTVQNLENGIRLSEGKEAKIERALGWKIGSLDRIRSGGDPVPDDSGDIFQARDEFEREVLASVISDERKRHWIQRHRAALEEEARLLRELRQIHPKIVTGDNG